MAVLAGKTRRYVVAGEFSVRDESGLVCHLVGGHVLPENLQRLLSQDEINTHLACGMFRPVGWTPPPAQAEVPSTPPTPPTPQEIIDSLGLAVAGPRGVELRELDKPPSPKDLAACAATGAPAVVLVHRLDDGTAVATLDFARLMALYASMPGAFA